MKTGKIFLTGYDKQIALGSKLRLFKGNPGFSTKKIQIRVPGISPAKNKMPIVCQTRAARLLYGPALPLGKLRIENYDFCKSFGKKSQ